MLILPVDDVTGLAHLSISWETTKKHPSTIFEDVATPCNYLQSKMAPLSEQELSTLSSLTRCWYFVRGVALHVPWGYRIHWCSWSP